MSKKTLLNEYLTSKKEYEENKTMNLSKLFEMQKELDQHIIEEKGLEGQDLLDKKILALQVELGELANEWQMFKFWKDNPKPNEKALDLYKLVWTNPLLEEYVDCLHFILSIGLELDSEIRKCVIEPLVCDEYSITNQFIEINYQSHLVISAYEYKKSDVIESWFTLVDLFAGLGEMLGFTWEQIEQAYFEKNKVNHERQENGY